MADAEDAELDALLQQLESFDMPVPKDAQQSETDKEGAYDNLVRRPEEYQVPKVAPPKRPEDTSNSRGEYDVPRRDPSSVYLRRKSAATAASHTQPLQAATKKQVSTYAVPAPVADAPSRPANKKAGSGDDDPTYDVAYAQPAASDAAQYEKPYATPYETMYERTYEGAYEQPDVDVYEDPNADKTEPQYERADPDYETASSSSSSRRQLYEQVQPPLHSADRVNNEALPKGFCAQCRQRIQGRAIQALGLQFHEEHFQCMKCDKSLASEPFHAHHGLPFCSTCFHEETAPRCAGCDKPITTACIHAFSKNWHVECLKCDACHNPLGTEYYNVENQTICSKCYEDQVKYKCAKCKKTITDAAISALDSYWHEACFTCWECNKPFPEGRYFPQDNKPYCSYHYHEMKGVVCARCMRPIIGSFVSALGEKWHPEHFQCSLCNKSLAKTRFRERNDQPYCDPCYVKLFGI
ncbi:hypothetical protein PTSG_08126 [Salpingoeca rosetta]|uniref:LIM zinc-binding domain-containing protein n=1 Tax=Salpingoeca rosetta (strain ATCC 50818 / BSB-021) TaxID=946362 RepID=F2UI26_SALR5|nr:uncharacterized protein PTSG_08126 [Salpingoeca rosetta]EGD76775.1 hypothetical protein PTSG_08126 [Salpingoeca rosetta]|eukprot:XP_004991147.1 hypothetical protein PTSG_08126 [Salpingoeca rosetta]